MPILPSRRPGPYEILARIRPAWIDEVHRVRETLPGHIVAVNVLPAHLADRCQYIRARYER